MKPKCRPRTKPAAPSPHKHTDECLRYAALTGKPYCIKDCADSRRQLERQGNPELAPWEDPA